MSKKRNKSALATEFSVVVSIVLSIGKALGLRGAEWITWFLSDPVAHAKLVAEKLLELLPTSWAVEMESFFSNCPGEFWRSPEFVDRILKPGMAQGPADPVKLGEPYKLTKDMTGSQLLEALGESRVIEASQMLATIKEIVASQPGGKSGTFRTDGWGELFLVRGKDGEVFVVFVYWSRDYRKWYVSANDLGYRWYAGNRVF